MDEGAITPGLNGANGNPLELGEVVCLKKRLGNTLFKIRYIKSERLPVHSIIGTEFMKRHVFQFSSQEQNFEFPQGKVSIIGHGNNKKSYKDQLRSSFWDLEWSDSRFYQTKTIEEDAVPTNGKVPKSKWSTAKIRLDRVIRLD